MNSKPFKQYLVEQKYTASTIKSYQFIIGRYIKQNPNAAYYGFKEVLDYFKSFLLKNTDRPGIILLQSGIKKYYDYLLEEGKITKHPCRGLNIKYKRKNLIHQDLFSQNELSKLLKREERYPILKYRNRLLISLLIYQGLSSSELTNLMLTDINLDSETITIKGSISNNKRVLDLTPSQIKLIGYYLQKCRTHLQNTPNMALILNMKGNPIAVQDIHYLIETNKLMYPERKLTAQTIRQSVIANWLNDFQIPLEDVQLLAGHKRPSATLKYKQPLSEHMIRDMNLFYPL